MSACGVSNVCSYRGLRKSYVVVHGGRSQQENASIVGPLHFVDVATIQRSVRTIIKEVLLIHQTTGLRPIEGLLGPLCVAVVPSVQGETSAKVEEASIRDGVLVVITSIEGEDLPSQATVAVLVVPSRCLRVENPLGQLQPLGFVRWRIWELLLGSSHGCHPPKALIIIALRLGLVRCHVIIIWTCLPKHALCDYVVVGAVVGVIVIVD